MHVVVQTKNNSILFGAADVDPSLPPPEMLPISGVLMFVRAADGYMGGLEGLASSGPPPGSLIVAGDDATLNGKSGPARILAATPDAIAAWEAFKP